VKTIPRHIAMIIPTLDQIGGAERQVLVLAKELLAHDWRVTIVALSGSLMGSQVLQEGDGSERRIEHVCLAMRKAWIDPFGWLGYLAWHRNNRPDVVHAHLPHAIWFARWVRLLAPVPVLIGTIHTSKAPRLSGLWGYRLSEWLSTRTTCVSAAVAGAIAAACTVPENKLIVVPNGVPIPDIQFRKERASENFVWIAVGRLAPVKDYPTLLRAFAGLSDSAKLIIVGSGSDEWDLKHLSCELGIVDRVEFAGFRDDVQSLLWKADAFVLSSLWEGLPICVLEASATGLPVVATDGLGTRAALIPDRTGFIVPVGDSDSLMSAMARMMTMTTQEQRSIGDAGREFVRDGFAIPQVGKTWVRLYTELLEISPRPRRWH